MAIVIPVNAYIVTLNGVDPHWTESEVQSAFKGANLIWNKAGISFSARSIGAFSDKVMGDSTSDVVDLETYFYLASQYSGRDCPTAFFIRKFGGIEGGKSTTANNTNWILASEYSSNQAMASRILAHELGHLLNIEKHINEGFTVGPSTPLPVSMRENLMFSALLTDSKLDTDQIKIAKSSPLAKKFGG
jgi:hypothetical protein